MREKKIGKEEGIRDDGSSTKRRRVKGVRKKRRIEMGRDARKKGKEK